MSRRRKWFPPEIKKALVYNARVEYLDPYTLGQWDPGTVISPPHLWWDGGPPAAGERVRISGDNGMQLYCYPNAVRLVSGEK